jgi:hypothetical protein
MTNQISIDSLPSGTGVKTTAFWGGMRFTHYGILDRTWDGSVVIHHNSKRHGRAVTTDLFGFSDGQIVFLDTLPANLNRGWEIAERARTDVERGVTWTVVNNCEDMKSRALTGQWGSPTRNAIVGLGVAGVLLALVLGS